MLMGINLYAVAFIISVVMILLLLVVTENRNVSYYLLMFIMIMFTNMGYYVTSTSQTLETALVGHRLIYMGGVFVPIFLLLSTLKLCRFEISTWLNVFLGIMSTIVLVGAFSVGSSDLYYRNVSIGQEEGITYLIREYGPMHTLYMLLLFGCILAIIGVVMYSFIAEKNVPQRVAFYMLLITVITTSCYLVKRITGSVVELVVFAYVLDECLLILLINRIGRYEIRQNVANALDGSSTNGYIAFDERRHFVSCNDKAKLFLPELERLKIDKPLDENKVPILYKNFGECFKKEVVEETRRVIEKDERYLECTLKILCSGKKGKSDGYLIEMIDDTAQHKYFKLRNSYYDDLEREVREKTERVSMLKDRMVLALADMIENRDSSTGGHIKRTSEVIRIFVSELIKYKDEYGFTEEFLNNIIKAAPMHDLGKVAVDDRILRKPGSITEEEFEEMKKHSEKGAEIVLQILDGVEDEEFVRIARNIALYHHEKWDGKGYPIGISGYDIPPEARIMALADVFDALICQRCYKEKMDYDQAFGIIENSLGSHFEPEIGGLFIKCRPQLEAFYDAIQ